MKICIFPLHKFCISQINKEKSRVPKEVKIELSNAEQEQNRSNYEKKVAFEPQTFGRYLFKNTYFFKWKILSSGGETALLLKT